MVPRDALCHIPGKIQLETIEVSDVSEEELELAREFLIDFALDAEEAEKSGRTGAYASFVKLVMTVAAQRGIRMENLVGAMLRHLIRQQATSEYAIDGLVVRTE